MSLFDDGVPPLKRHHADCCADLPHIAGVRRHHVAYIHELAHSRIPFTYRYLTTIIDSELAIKNLLVYAKHNEWIETIQMERRYDTPRQWVGRLTKKR